jgi:hypothetical protein
VTGPSKPLTPTELDEALHRWTCRRNSPHDYVRQDGFMVASCKAAAADPRLLATLDATQAVEPDPATCCFALHPHDESCNRIEVAAELAMQYFAAARSSSAPAELPELDAAWREAEEALPEGWNVHLYSHRESGQFVAFPTAVRGEPVPFMENHGPTPAAALRALARRLTSSPENPA